MEKLKIYFIGSNHINYLRKYDSKVAYNNVPNRPYIGVVYKYNGFHYFAPLSSPKPKHTKLKNSTIDIFKIKDGKLGIININNMFPTPIEALIEAIPNIHDKKYKALLIEQLDFINHHREVLYHKVKQFQQRYRKGYIQQHVLERCYNFSIIRKKMYRIYSKQL